jgi:SNF2 family DNA or RNA helicase
LSLDAFADFLKVAAMLPGFKLKPHQQEAVDRQEANDGSLLIAHGTGTGKTPTSVASFEHLMAKGLRHRALVVTPAPLRDNFIDEGVHKFTDSSAIRFGAKGEAGSHRIDEKNLPDATYGVVSNELFRANPHAYIDKFKPDHIIWDEAHKGRDPNSSTFAAMKSVRHRVKGLTALTGTPINNHPHDLVPLIDLVSNGHHHLGNQAEFDKRFTKTVNRRKGPLAFFGVGPVERETVIQNEDHLKRQLRQHVHYVATEDIAKDMPKKQIHDHDVEMSAHQAKLYRYSMRTVDPLTRWKIGNNLPVGTREATHIFGAIMKARQASNGLHTLDAKHTPLTSAQETPKAMKLLGDVDEHLRANPHHKAIIHTNLVHGGIDELVAGLRAKGHEPGIFIGGSQPGVNKATRDAHVADYLSGRKRVMVINQAGAEGLNLPGTSAHFSMDPHWNPALGDQFEARGIRSGSPVDTVHVHRYKSILPRPFGMPFLKRETGTDEWIYGIADRKRKLNDQFLGILKDRHKAARQE